MEVVTLAVMQAVPGFASEARWLRLAASHLRHLFPHLPKQPGHGKRLRRQVATLNWLVGALADISVWSGDVWVVDSTPVEYARSRDTVHRSASALYALIPLPPAVSRGIDQAADARDDDVRR